MKTDTTFFYEGIDWRISEKFLHTHNFPSNVGWDWVNQDRSGEGAKPR